MELYFQCGCRIAHFVGLRGTALSTAIQDVLIQTKKNRRRQPGEWHPTDQRRLRGRSPLSPPLQSGPTNPATISPSARVKHKLKIGRTASECQAYLVTENG